MTKIAIIEDETSIRQMYTFRLQAEGYEVRSADNGQSGLTLIHEFEPELVLLDLRMPVMTGDEMLQKLRETELGAHMKVIILTNISKDEAPKQLRLLHVDRYVVKAHHTPHQITEIVKELVG